jgi:Fur family iron response transcriptional regulator
MELTAPPGAPGANGCERRLTECGIRPTAQRVRIAALLLSAPQHLSAEQILAQLRALGARVSKATVYNTLNLFADRGLIWQLSANRLSVV